MQSVYSANSCSFGRRSRESQDAKRFDFKFNSLHSHRAWETELSWETELTELYRILFWPRSSSSPKEFCTILLILSHRDLGRFGPTPVRRSGRNRCGQ